jgi:uncharacterized protein (TIGR00730 family)
MQSMMKRIVVFCGSSEGTDPQVLEEAYALGATLAREGLALVYGAARIGVMGMVARGALEQKGEVIGVIPGFLKKKEVFHTGLSELIITQSMHERKLKMHELSDAVLALPGGFGTLEELFEMITWAQLGLHQKPIGILNINGFYDDLLRLLEKMVAMRFLSKENYDMLLVSNQLPQLLDMMEAYRPKYIPKWIKNDQV